MIPFRDNHHFRLFDDTGNCDLGKPDATRFTDYSSCVQT